MSVTRQLYQLQEFDLELEQNEKAQGIIVGQLGESQKVLQTRAKLAENKSDLEQLLKQQHGAEWEIDDLNVKLTTMEKKLYSGTIANPKELSNLQLEIEDLKTRRGKLEDKTLETMDRVESITGTVSELTRELGELEAGWKAQQDELSGELQELKQRHAHLDTDRQQHITRIDTALVELYQGLKKQKKTAVARVEQGTCRGCQITLPTTEIQQAKGGKLVRCSSCGRILFLA